jgi:hypothetical protein
MFRPPSKPSKPMLVVNARQNGTGPGDTAAGGARLVRVPVGENVNGGNGVHAYLLKRDARCGKPIFYSPEVWTSMTDAQRADARDFRPVENDDQRNTASNLMNAFVSADPLAKKALVEMLAPMLREQMAAPAPAPTKGGGR